MKVLRVLPLLFAPLFGESINNFSSVLRAEESKITSGNPTLTLPNPLTLDSIFNSTKNLLQLPKLPELKEKEKKALNEIEDFLIKHTGNEKLSYGTIDRLITGLLHDYKAVNNEGMYLRGFKGIAARRYPNNIFNFAHRKVKNEIVRRAYSELVDELNKLGIDPNTANLSDSAEITYLVTKEELEQLKQNSFILRKMSKRYLPPNKKIIFEEGISIEDIRFIKSRKLGIPPGGKIVDDN